MDMLNPKSEAAKLIRDLVAAALAGALLYVSEHAADFGVSPEIAVVVVPLVLYAYRRVRTWAGLKG